MLSSKKIFVVVDGSNYIYRAYHTFATRDMVNQEGMPTNAIYIYTTMLMKMLNEFAPDYCAMVFDSSRNTSRKEIYAAYKGTRTEPMPEKLVQQLPYIKRVTEYMGIKVLSKMGFEADDIVATLVKTFSKGNIATIVVTGDKDLMQLVCENVVVYDAKRGGKFNATKVVEQFGVSPNMIADLLGLMGDTADNIPGIKGIGHKTAAKLLVEAGNLESVIEHVADIKSAKVRQLISEYCGQALLSKRLATLDCAVDMGVLSLNDFATGLPNYRKLNPVFRKLGFNSLINKNFRNNI